MNTVKKFISSFVTLTTVVWSVGGALLVPSMAQAATLSPGDLIKASGAAVYYYSADGKRYVFPNEKTYFSWYSDFSSVVTITDAELAAIMIGGNVTIRPGTKLVKITTDPKVYAVSGTCAMLHWVETEEIAKSLYGNDWATRVVDVPDAFFVDYEVGSSLSSAVHPDGQIIKYASDASTYYVVESGLKRKLSSAGITANKLNTGMAVETTVTYSNGSDVTGYEAGLGKVACESDTVVVNGSVNVALASDTPAGKTVPKNAASVELAKFTLTADSNDALVTGLHLSRIGVGATTDFSNVYLYDGNGTRLTTGRTINSATNNVEFNGLNLSISANSSKSIVVVGDFSSPNTTGGQHAFEISDAASVVISGSGSVGGSFPVRANTFTVGTTLAGTLTVTEGTAPSNPNIGSIDAEIGNFKLAASTNDISIRRITLLQAGDISNSDLSDLKLYQGDTVVATTPSVVGDKIVLSLDPAFVIEDGITKTFSLRATIGGRSGRTIKTYVEYTTDISATDLTYNSGAAVNIDAYDGDADGTQYSEVTTQGGQLTVAFNGPTTGNVAKGSQDVVLYKFALTTSDNDLEIRRLRFRIDSTSGGTLEDTTAGTDFFTDIKIKDADTGVTLMGPTSISAGVTSGTSFALTDVFNLKAGTTKNLAITADIANSTDTELIDNKYRACLSNDTATAVAAGTAVTTVCAADDAIFALGDVKIVSTGENLAVAKIVPNAAIAGNELTVRSSSLSVALASTPSAGTAVKKQKDIPSVGFVFTAGSESKSLIRSISVTGVGRQADTGNYTAALFNDVVSGCSLYEGATKKGESKSPDSVTGAMNFTSLNIEVPAGTSKTIVVKCDAQTTVDGAQDYYALGLSGTTAVTAEDTDNNEITVTPPATVEANDSTAPSLAQTVKSSGSLTVAAGSQPSGTIVLGGNTIKYAEFKATAEFEDVTIDKITVTSTGESANFSNIVVKVAGTEVGSTSLTSGADSYKDISLTTPVTVAKGGNATFEIYGTLADVVSSSSVSGATTGVARTGASSNLGMGANVTDSPWDSNYSGKFNIMAVGGASGDRLYATGVKTVGNAMILRKGKPVITKLASVNDTLSTGSPVDLYKFQISADAAGDSVSWIQMVLQVATSSGVGALDSFALYKGSSPLTANTQVFITNNAGNDLTGATSYVAGSSGLLVIIRLASEEIISGTGTVYTLRATPTLVSDANTKTVTTSFVRSVAGTYTGYLALAAASYRMGLDPSNTYDGAGLTTGTFLWSDNSETTHAYATGTSSSRDWTDDTLIESMNDSNTLSN